MIRNFIWIVVAVVVATFMLIKGGIQLPHIKPSFNFSDGVDGGIIGIIGSLFGAAIGSYTAYRYNVTLEKERTKERRAIQTKNTIISPIYKQLLGLKEYIDKQQIHYKRPEIIVYFTDYSRSNAYTFNIWESIKKDIRKRYVPQSNRDDLERLTKAIRGHMDLEFPEEPPDSEIAFRFYLKHKDDIIDAKRWNHHQLANIFKYHIEGSDSVQSPKKVVETCLRQGFNLPDEKYAQYTEQLIEEVATAHDEQYAQLEPSLECLIKTLDEVTASFEKMVDNIIEKYEGGIDVK